ncbi:MAG TPA: ribosome biogenesis GTPase Der [Nitrospirae bacterium]|nr:ribosome biogenesis GTPase Der [Nitrospirota bacterium]
MFYIAIVGRPNVGKSTLFNKIVGGRPAIVDGIPGVTRDRNIASVEKYGRRFGLIDSGGFELKSEDIILSQAQEQTQMAIEESDIIYFVVDGKEGITPIDEQIARSLRKAGKQIRLVVNKIDNPSVEPKAQDFARLGFSDIFPVSAEHSIGIEGLLEETVRFIPEEKDEAVSDDEVKDQPVKLAVVGKPNVGKSSMVNKLLGTGRMMVSEIAGTTRDSIDSEIERDGRKYTLIDTAGIRRKAKVTNKLEKFSVIMAIKAIERSDVALLLIDAIEGVTIQETKIAGLIDDAGKGCVIVVNKWDIVEKDDKTTLVYEEKIRARLKFLSHAPIMFVSSLTGQRLDKIFDVVMEVYGQCRKRIGSGKLNSMMERVTLSRRPSLFRNKRVKIYYATQASIMPPTFIFMTNSPRGVHFSYRRYIANQIRINAGFDKAPLRLIFRKPSGRRTYQGQEK